MVRLCEIPSPSREEGRVAELVRAELAAMGAEVHEDDAAAARPAGCGNIVARFAPTAEGTPIMFGVHLDTVPVTDTIDVELVDGYLANAHDAILGGDNKSAVAVVLQAMKQVVGEQRPHAGVELVFTPCEEIERAGLVVSGRSPNGRRVESVELPEHPWFCASPYHPEFTSRPTRPQPLFREFVGAAAGHAGAREAEPARERAALGG